MFNSGQVIHICVVCSARSHNLNQYWFYVDRTHGNRSQWQLKSNKPMCHFIGHANMPRDYTLNCFFSLCIRRFYHDVGQNLFFKCTFFECIVYFCITPTRLLSVHCNRDVASVFIEMYLYAPNNPTERAWPGVSFIHHRLQKQPWMSDRILNSWLNVRGSEPIK